MKAVGKARKYRRIQETLDNCEPHGVSFADVARGLGVSRALVSLTARGHANNRRVLKRFLELGVNPHDLDLPPDMRGDAGNIKRKVA